MEPPLEMKGMLGPDGFSRTTAALAAAKPAWSVGAGLFAYHGMTFGHLAGELIERVSGERLVPGMLTPGGAGGAPGPLGLAIPMGSHPLPIGFVWDLMAVTNRRGVRGPPG